MDNDWVNKTERADVDRSRRRAAAMDSNETSDITKGSEVQTHIILLAFFSVRTVRLKKVIAEIPTDDATQGMYMTLGISIERTRLDCV